MDYFGNTWTCAKSINAAARQRRLLEFRARGAYDECTTPRDRALKAIPKVPCRAKHPVYGKVGPLLHLRSGRGTPSGCKTAQSSTLFVQPRMVLRGTAISRSNIVAAVGYLYIHSIDKQDCRSYRHCSCTDKDGC